METLTNTFPKARHCGTSLLRRLGAQGVEEKAKQEARMLAPRLPRPGHSGEDRSRPGCPSLVFHAGRKEKALKSLPFSVESSVARDQLPGPPGSEMESREKSVYTITGKMMSFQEGGLSFWHSDYPQEW